MTSKQSPLVSFIVPIYNTERYLPACLDSILNQTIKDIEIICINDASPDNSKNILAVYAEKDKRIHVLDFNKNMGRGAARNAGIKHATGTFLRMVDSDDFIPLNSTEKLLNAALQYKSDFVRGGFWRCGPDGIKNRRGGRYPDNLLINGSFKNNKELWHFDQHTTYLYKKNLIKKAGARYDESMSNGEDVAFIIQLIPHMKLVTLIPETVYYYRNHPGSVMLNKKSKRYYLNLFELYVKEMKELAPLGFQEQVDYFIYYHLSALLPNVLLPSMFNNLSNDDALEALKFLKSFFCNYNIEALCFMEKYSWQHELSLPTFSQQFVVLLARGHISLAYELVKEIDSKRKLRIKERQLRAENKQLKTQNKELHSLKKQLEKQLQRQQYKINCIYKSTSWRITAPLRKLGDKFNRDYH